jgi:PAS domain-containing protein
MLEAPFLSVVVVILAIITAALLYYIVRLQNRPIHIDTLPDGVLAIDRSGRITQANPAAVAILGESN